MNVEMIGPVSVFGGQMKVHVSKQKKEHSKMEDECMIENMKGQMQQQTVKSQVHQKGVWVGAAVEKQGHNERGKNGVQKWCDWKRW